MPKKKTVSRKAVKKVAPVVEAVEAVEEAVVEEEVLSVVEDVVVEDIVIEPVIVKPILIRLDDAGTGLVDVVSGKAVTHNQFRKNQMIITMLRFNILRSVK